MRKGPARLMGDMEEGKNLSKEEIKGIVETLLFATQKPLSVKEIKDIIEIEDTKIIREIIDEVRTECLQSERSFKLAEIAGGFQFTTDPVYAKWLRKLYKVARSDYLTRPSLETLSIIAYKQPVTRAEIEFIRGVNVDGIIKNLLQKSLIRISGKKKAIGAPFLYSTTRFFLQYFGLNSLEDLPQLPEFQESDIEFRDEMLVENEPRPSDDNEVSGAKEERGEPSPSAQKQDKPDNEKQIGGVQDESQTDTKKD